MLNAPHNELIEVWVRNVHACCSVPPPPVTKHSLTYVFSGHYGHRCERQLPAEISNQINQQLQCSGIGHYDSSAKDLPHPIRNPLVRTNVLITVRTEHGLIRFASIYLDQISSHYIAKLWSCGTCTKFNG